MALFKKPAEVAEVVLGLIRGNLGGLSVGIGLVIAAYIWRSSPARRYRLPAPTPEWPVQWAILCLALQDELPNDAVSPLSIAFKVGASTTHALFEMLNGRAFFIGQDAERNLGTLLYVLEPWHRIAAVANLRRACKRAFPNGNWEYYKLV